MPEPLISLITVSRNAAATIEKTLASVQAQTYRNIDYIVLDGASTDGTQAIIERYRPLLSCYHSRPDNGPYEATEQGFKLARGEIVGLLMADDWLAPHAMEELAELYAANPQAQLFCFGLQECRAGPGGSLFSGRIFRDTPTPCFTLEESLYCHGLNRFYRRDLLDLHGRFKAERYRQMADRELYVRLGRAGLNRAVSASVLYYFFVHPASNSMSGNPGKTALLLYETVLIASDYLRSGTLDAVETALFKQWYCFNAIRLAWFRLRAGQWSGACAVVARALSVYPLCMARCMLRYKIPAPYRPVAP